MKLDVFSMLAAVVAAPRRRREARRRPPIHVSIGTVEGQLTAPSRLRKRTTPAPVGEMDRRDVQGRTVRGA
jgi:hypothetical protein